MYVLGLDVGTQGVRVLVCNADGNIVAQASESFISHTDGGLPTGHFEQSPEDWWSAASACLKRVVGVLVDSGRTPESIGAIAVDSTSGTIIPLDESGLPLRPAIMYNDTRAASTEADECNIAGRSLTDKLGYRFAESFALPKILWLIHHEPDVFERASCFVHAADYIVGRLTGEFGVSDTSNALKTGYDLVDRCWPGFIEDKLGIPVDKLPSVVVPGTVIGAVSKECAGETGLASGTPVAAGVTDGTAGFFASGAVKVGDWNSTIGTTLVMRGVSSDLIKDSLGRIYCHSHPMGYWLPGGASNVGAECIAKLFAGRDLDDLNAYVPQYVPTPLIVYPLVRRGERFPFVNSSAEGFMIGEPRDSRELYAAYLEGVGFVERWCLEMVGSLGAEVGDTVFTTGGGARSGAWMQVRADVLGRKVVRPMTTECAMGAAAVAASAVLFSDIEESVRSMIKPGDSVEPDPSKVGVYDDRYAAFRDACAARGYK